MKKLMMNLVVFVCAGLFCVSLSYAGKTAIDEEKVREIVKEVIKDNPELIYNTLNKYAKEQRTRQQEQLLESSFTNRTPDVVGSNNPTKGPENAPITITEYTDFQCSFCSRGANTVLKLLKLYPGKVRLAFKNNPLSFHKQALPAAKAALAAHKQGKFWEYHDLLFKNASALNEQMFVKLAKDLNLDVDKFNNDRSSDEIAKQIEAEKAHAAKLKLTGTPTFIANGVVIKGAQPLDYFTKVVERLLSEGK